MPLSGEAYFGLRSLVWALAVSAGVERSQVPRLTAWRRGLHSICRPPPSSTNFPVQPADQMWKSVAGKLDTLCRCWQKTIQQSLAYCPALRHTCHWQVDSCGYDKCRKCFVGDSENEKPLTALLWRQCASVLFWFGYISLWTRSSPAFIGEVWREKLHKMAMKLVSRCGRAKNHHHEKGLCCSCNMDLWVLTLGVLYGRIPCLTAPEAAYIWGTLWACSAGNCSYASLWGAFQKGCRRLPAASCSL